MQSFNPNANGVDVADPVMRMHRWRGYGLHLCRVGIVAAILGLVRWQHVEHVSASRQTETSPVTIEPLRRLYPQAAKLGERRGRNGAVQVFDAAGESLGFFVHTSPSSDSIIGYSGPTDTLIAFDHRERVLGIQILHSSDTREHVDQVLRDERFLAALAGRTWGAASSTRDIDAVSGATLTSLAILEGIAFRLGGNQPSLKFPDEIDLVETREYFPTAAALRPRPEQPAVVDVLDADGRALGAVLRTSPAADNIMGYQGPTDTLVAVDSAGHVLRIGIRKSFDNQPYVGYVRDETYFRELFNGKTLEELGKLDPQAERIEGVSGATMTSQAIAQGLPRAATYALQGRVINSPRIVWSLRDAGTIAVLVAACTLGFSRLRGMRWLRMGYLLLLIGYFGFANGDLLSQALLVGWAQSGVSWRLAPGLVLLTAAAFVVPITTKRQVYCHHICPFGAAQQLIPTVRKVHLSSRVTRALNWIPATLLLVVVLTALLHWNLNLASIEPFDAFLVFLGVTSVAALAIAVAGLAATAFVPMAYCRFGCPTGALLNYLRYNARSDRITRRDVVAASLLLLAILLRSF